MPNGHYDDEAGVCWPDDVAPAPDAPPEYQSQLPPECYSETLGYDDNCLDWWMISNALDELWNWLFGNSE